jgi:hypothetical protein
MKRLLPLTFLLVLICVTVGFTADRTEISGTIYITPRHPVYTFLTRLWTKGFLPHAALSTKPWTRVAITRELLAIDRRDMRLTPHDGERIGFYLGEFADEVVVLGADSVLKSIRPAWWSRAARDSAHRFYRKVMSVHGDVDRTLRLTASLGYDVTHDTTTTGYRHAAVGAQARLGKHWGAQAAMWDIAEWGDDILPRQQYDRKPGVAYIDGDTASVYYYDDPEAMITWGNDMVTASFGTYPVVFGPGVDGNVVLSGNAPPVPTIRLSVHPWDWLTFTYLHMSLQSGVRDTAGVWYRSTRGSSSALVSKYYVAHRVEFTGIRGVNIGLGESVIYGARGTELMYMIPVVPFRAAQHDVGDLDNLQMWADFSVSRLPWTRVYGAMLIDELFIAEIMSSERNHNWWCWQLGTQVADLWGMVPDVDLTVEYTRANPRVYRHRYGWNTYDTWGMQGNRAMIAYPLGFWLGQNSDALFADIAWRASRDVSLRLWGSRTRKGGEDSDAAAYESDVLSREFLYGTLTATSEVHAEASWELFRDVVLTASVGRVKSENDVGTSKSWMSFGMGLNYNVW